MPAVFGTRSERPEVRRRQREHYARVWGTCRVEESGRWLVGAHAFESAPAVRRVGGVQVGVDGEPVSVRRLSALRSVPGGAGETAAALRGNVFLWEPASGRLVLECHESGYLPLYWATRDGEFRFGSSLRDFAGAGWREPDPAAVVSFLRGGYTPGDRTLLRGVRRLRPGQVLELGPDDKEPALQDVSHLWHEEDVPNDLRWDPIEAARLAWSQLVEATDASFAPDERPSLLMSGGWDSRTLLAALLTASRRPVGYSHGDPDSREIALVRRYTRALGVELVFQPIDDRCLDADWLAARFARTETAVFPHWHRAAEVLGDAGYRTAATGIFGGVIGGHNGPGMVLGGAAKVAAVARDLVAPRLGSRRIPPETAAEWLRPRSFGRPWYLTQEWWGEAGDVVSSLRASVERELATYRERGIERGEALVEAFVTEHRGSQYIGMQPRSFRANLSGAQPFVESDLLRLATGLPLSTKIHNRIHQRMLLDQYPELAAYPLAAVLVAARRPILLQESSRLARRIGEQLSQRVRRVLGAGPLPPRLSWVNFEFLRSSDRVKPLIESLRLPWWNRAALHAAADALARGEESPTPHGFFDQLMKIVTVDATFESG